MTDIRLLFIGDIVGDVGLHTVVSLLPDLRQELALDMVVANGENLHEGKGLNENMVRKLYRAGVDVITGGDHSFDKHLIFGYMNAEPHLLRPYNYPPGVPGHGYHIHTLPDLGLQVAVLNLRGQVFFSSQIRCPFYTAEQALRDIKQHTDLVFVDFHAEATAEKKAIGWFLDGQVSALVGTHTHVQTADECILPGGTAYLTDVGFTGAHDSVIGMDKHTSISRFRQQIPHKHKLAEGDPRLSAALIVLDAHTAKARSIARVVRQAPPMPPKALQAADDEPKPA